MPSFRRLLVLSAAVTAAAAFHAAPALASATQETVLQDDAQLFADPQGTLGTLTSLGVTRVRVSVYWSVIAPNANSFTRPPGFVATDPASYGGAWATYDAIVRAAARDGISLFFTLTGPAPLWATGSGMPSGGPYGQWKPSAREFGQFVRAIGRRYSGSYTPPGGTSPLPRVSFWSIWNEPNYGPDLAPQATSDDKVELSAAEYRSLLDAAWRSLLRTGHRPGTDTILIGETAPRGLNHPIGNFSGIKPLRFIRALYCVDSRYRQLRGAAAAARGCPTTAAGSSRFARRHPALFQAGGFADHPYEQGVAPNTPTIGPDDPKTWRTDPDYADLPEVPRLERMLDRIQRLYGSHTRLRVWNTEYGYRTRPPDPRATINQATAAYYMNWAEYLSWRQKRLASYSQYLLQDPVTDQFASGLLLPNGRPKATFYAFRMPLFLPVTSARRGRRLQVWGCVRPAHVYPGAQVVEIQFQAGSKGPFRTLYTVPIVSIRGYFDVRESFSASGSVRLSWKIPSGPRIYSRVVKIAVR
jgi:hypothetical protein